MKLKRQCIKIIAGMLIAGTLAAGCENANVENEDFTGSLETIITEVTEIAEPEVSDDEWIMLEQYKDALENLNKNGILPDGQDAYVGYVKDAWPNKAALCDIDGDGQDELILSVGGTCMADCCLYVFQYDGESETFQCELAVWPCVSFYTNGVVVEQASHNHGLSYNVDFWPYSVICYDFNTDLYQRLFEVDGWEKEYYPVDYDGNDFPDEADADGDGFLYRITDENDDKLTILDGSDYEIWFDNLIGDAKEIQIPFIEWMLQNK